MSCYFLPFNKDTLIYENEIGLCVVIQLPSSHFSNFRKDLEKSIRQEIVNYFGEPSWNEKLLSKWLNQQRKHTWKKSHVILCVQLPAAGSFFIYYCHLNIFIFLPLGIKMQLIHHLQKPISINNKNRMVRLYTDSIKLLL